MYVARQTGKGWTGALGVRAYALVLAAAFLMGAGRASEADPGAMGGVFARDARVVVLHSYHYGFTWTDNISEGISSAFAEEAKGVEVKFEFLDTRFCASDVYLRSAQEALGAKYADRKVDVLIASDDHALSFMLTQGRDVFPGVPVVFCSVSGYRPEMRKQLKVTGLRESIDIRSTVATALRLHPETEEIAVIVDSSRTGQELRRTAATALEAFADDVRVRYLEDMTVAQLERELPQLPKNTVVLLLIFRPDESGRVLSHEQNLERLRPHCPFPIYAVWQFYLGHGIVGGRLTNGNREGGMAARMALRILGGEDAADIPLDQSPVQYMFDHAELARFGIRPDALPVDSLIVNEPFSFYGAYKTRIWILSAAFVLLMAIIVVLMVDVDARRRAETALAGSNRLMTTLLENLQVGVFMVESPTGKPLLANKRAAELLGRAVLPEAAEGTLAEVYGAYKNGTDQLYPSDRMPIVRGLRGEDSYVDDMVVVRPDGSRALLEVHGTPVKDDVGNITASLVSFAEITERKRAEEALRQSEEKYRYLVENANSIILRMDVAGNVTFLNEFAQRFFGYTEEEILGRNVVGTIMPGTENSGRDLRAMIAGIGRDPDRYATNENEAVCHDGRQVWIAWTNRAVCDEGGATVEVLCVGNDVTERKRAEEALRQSEERFRTLADNIPEVVYLCRNDERYTMLYLNEAVEALTGYPREDFLEDRISFVDLYHPDDMAAIAPAVERALGRREAFHLAYRIRHRDGQWRWVEEYGAGVFEGESLRLLEGLLIDTTEQRSAQEERERFMHAIEQAAEAIVITDVEGTIQYVNPAFARVTGYERDEAQGRNPRILKSGEQDGAFYQEMWDTLRRGDVWRGRFVNKRKDGTLYTEDAVISPVRDASQRTVNYVAVKRDVTEQISLEKQLRQAQKMEAVGQLAGGVAHDFNNQLAGITSYAELLLGRLVDEKGRHYVDMILQAAQRAADSTAQLLAYSRKAELRVARVDVHALVAEVVSLLSHTIDRRITIKQVLTGGTPVVLGDPSQLENALLNIAINARDAMPDGGELVLATEAVTLNEAFCRSHPHGVVPGPFIQVSVSDTGAGMDEDTVTHIFEPFFTTKGVEGGTGLGLAAVYGTVRSHGGTLEVETRQGHGTVLRLYLPLAPAGGDDAVKEEATTAATVAAARILLVDDEEPLREACCEALRGLGYNVVPCGNGAEAVEYYGRSWREVDVVILDMVMPKMSGPDAFRAMRAVNPGVKVLFLSGFSLDSGVQAVLDEGALDYLQKPFRLADLHGKLSRALGRKSGDAACG